MTTIQRRYRIDDIDDSQFDNKAEVLETFLVPVQEVLLWEENPKEHDIGDIIQSIVKNGFKDPPTWDNTLGGIVEGNGRTTALKQMEIKGYDAPRGIIVHKGTGEWFMPMHFGIDAVSVNDARRYAIDHNNLVLSGGDLDFIDISRIWDKEAYTNMLLELYQDDELPLTVDIDDLEQLSTPFVHIETGAESNNQEESSEDEKSSFLSDGDIEDTYPINGRVSRRLYDFYRSVTDGLGGDNDYKLSMFIKFYEDIYQDDE